MGGICRDQNYALCRFLPSTMHRVRAGYRRLPDSAFSNEKRQLRHAAILAKAATAPLNPNSGPCANEVEVNILLGRNRYTVPGCRTKAPILKNCDRLFIESISQAANQNFINDVPLVIDCDLDDHIAFKAPWKVGRIHLRLRPKDGQRGLYLKAAR